MKGKQTTKKESKPMKLEVKKINTKQYKTRKEYNEAHKNDKQVENKKKRGKVIEMRTKKKTGTKTKIEKKKQAILRKNWRNVTIEDENAQRFFIGRPRIFKDPEELLKLFNCYISSLLINTKKKELVPVRTEEKEDDFLDILDDEIQSSKKENFKIDNTLVAKYEIVEDIEWKNTPTIGGFLIFLGGISYDTWENYKKKEDFFGTIVTIENYLESILTQRMLSGDVPANNGQFVLNTKYNRIPKSKSEEIVKTDIIDESEFIRN